MKKRTLPKRIFVACFYIALWQILSMWVDKELLLPAPLVVFDRLLLLMGRGQTYLLALASVGRIMGGFLLGILLGVLFAALCETFFIADMLLRPLITTIRAVPVASFIVLALVWMSGGRVPMFISMLMVLPVVWTNVSEGIRNTDKNLLEMCHSFHLGQKNLFAKLYIPSVLPYFTAACKTATGLAWKAGIAAEVLGSTKFSIGGAVYESKIYSETPELFAWTLLVVMLSVVFEKLFSLLIARVTRERTL